MCLCEVGGRFPMYGLIFVGFMCERFFNSLEVLCIFISLFHFCEVFWHRVYVWGIFVV